jgi:hypothetical protein
MKKPNKKQDKKELSVKKERTKASEYVGYLLELHKLQGTLLNQLNKEV